MASDLKKVGLVFKADGSIDFVKSLKVVNAELEENYSELKLAQSQYDKNTSTTQKLTDRLDFLTKQYDTQSKKVLILREELEELSNAENKDEAAISKKRAELQHTEAKLNDYDRSIKSVKADLESGTAAIKDFSNKLDSTSNGLTEAGKKFSVVSAGITGVGLAAKKSYDEVETGVHNTIKATGATGEVAKELEESYKNVAKTIVGDFSNIGSALGEINTRFGFTGSKLEDCTRQFVKFAEINNVDVTEAVRLVSRAMGDASIESSEYGNVLNSLTVAAQASGISIDKLTEYITKYGAPMRALGFDTKESIALFASWEKAGVNTEIAFSGMKQAISNFSKEGKDAKVEFKKLMEDIKNCPDETSASNLAMEKFGKKAGTDLADAIKNGRFEFSEMLDLIESSDDTVDKTFDGLTDGSYDAKLAMQEAKLAMSKLGDTLMTYLAPIFEKLSILLEKFSNWFEKLDSKQKKTIITIGLIVAAIGPVLLILGSLTGSLNQIILLFTKLGPVIEVAKKASEGVSSVFSFLAANPIVSVIAVIGLLIAAFIHLMNTNEEFRDKVLNIFNTIQNFFSSFDDFLTNIFQTDWTQNFGVMGEVLNGFLANVQNFYNAFKQILQGILDFVKGIFTGNWSLAWQGIKNIFAGVFNGFLAIAKTPINGIISFLNMLIGSINSLINGLNKINIKLPKWIPKIGGKSFGFNIGLLGKLSYLADGGTLLNGAAIVAEAGPELLLQQGNKTKVIPLSNNSNNSDYEDREKIDITINNNSKYISPAENARQIRKELSWYFLNKGRG